MSSGMEAWISMRTTSPSRRALQPRLELADEILRLFLDLDIGVADDAEQAASEKFAARKKLVEEQDQEALEGDEAALGRGAASSMAAVPRTARPDSASGARA